jgi:hypothetical protein
VETSARAARQLRKLGIDAAALAGRSEAWKARHPVEAGEARAAGVEA